MPSGRTISRGGPLGTLQILGFWDYGYGKIENDSSEETLSSVGFGLRYSPRSNMPLRIDYGYQQQGEDLDPDDDTVTHLDLVISY